MFSDTNQDAMESRDIIIGVVTPIDLLNYITNTENGERNMAYQSGSMHNSESE
jgi:hypothetical protein